MNKSNKYKIHYRIKYMTIFNNEVRWYIYIKKLKLRIVYQPGRYMIINQFNHGLSERNKTLNNFLVEPALLMLLNSDDILNKQLGFEILNTRLNERTG